MRLPVCVKCSEEFTPIKNNIMVLFSQNGENDCIYFADLYRCKCCGNKILAGFGVRAISYAGEEGFEDLAKKIDITIDKRENKNKKGEKNV